MFPLEHFYYGQLVHHGKPQSNMRLLAKSASVTEEQIAEAIRVAMINPSEALTEGTFALIRGRQVPFFLVQSQKGQYGQIILHIIIVPTEVLRTIAGNLKALATLTQEQLPVYTHLGDDLVPLTLAHPGLKTTELQVETLLDLMTYTKNKMNTIEQLLSVIVKGMPLVVVNAPKVQADRVGFIQGLLTLLPSSTRYGVTFGTTTDDTLKVNLQIRFIDDGKAPTNAIIYDWESGQMEGDIVKDDYSRFIISQFRLDTELVIQQTEALTPVAGWRFRNGDSLSTALAYASHRISIDNAVTNNQPVEVADVSKALSEDPTLTPDLRVAYSRHLINLSLAIEDMSHTAPVAVMLHNNQQLSEDVYQQLLKALDDGHAYLIYETLLDWMGHPLGPQGNNWIELTYKASLSYLDELVADQDYEAIDDYVDSIQSASTGVAIGKAVPDILTKLAPLIDYDEAIALPLLSLAIQHMPKNQLEKVLTNATFRKHMPPPLLQFIAHLYSKKSDPAPPGTLMAAVETLSEKSQKDALLKFTQIAEERERPDLIDTNVLAGLYRTTQSDTPITHTKFLLDLVNEIMEKHLTNLKDDAGPLYLLQILYALHQYDLVAKDMIKVSRDFFGIDRQPEYIDMIQKLFADMRITANDATTVMVVIRRNGIKGLPYLTTCIGLLKGSNWASELTEIADESLDSILGNERYLDVIQPYSLLILLEYYARQKNTNKMIEVGRLIPDIAAASEADGPKTIRHMLKVMNNDRKAKSKSFEYLRRYIRKADNTTARKAIRHFSRNMSKEASRRLEVAYVMSRFLGGVDLPLYMDFLEITVMLLNDMAEIYQNNRPSTNELKTALKDIRMDIRADEDKELGKSLLQLGQAIVTLYEQYKDSSTQQVTGQLFTIESSSNMLDIFLIISSILGKRERFPYQLGSSNGSNPFRKRSGNQVLDDVDIANNVLRAPMVAMPPSKPIKYTSHEIADEIESQLRLIPREQHEDIGRSISRNIQRLVYLVNHIGSSGDAKALGDSNLANQLDKGQRPRNVLELYRFLYGHFSG